MGKTLAVIFDLDDTLCDYSKVKNVAKDKISKILLDCSINPKDFWTVYSKIEPKLFKKHCKGVIGLEEYRELRYLETYALLSNNKKKINLDVRKINKIYMDICNNQITYFNDVLPTMLFLKKNDVKIYILTNGPKDGQTQKIKKLHLDKVVDKYFISDSIGYSKPNKGAFDYVQKQIKVPKESMIMIGDSLENDYLGALKFGCRAIFLDRENKSTKNICKVRSLLELQNYIIL